jgi:K+-sensing histidine kinase KdpD
MGKGRASEKKDLIVSRYFRVPGSRIEERGLGLAIKKEFIEAQGDALQLTAIRDQVAFLPYH